MVITLPLFVPAVLTIEKPAASFLVDIPIGWPPRAKQQPAGLIAYGAAHRRPVRALYRPALTWVSG